MKLAWRETWLRLKAAPGRPVTFRCALVVILLCVVGFLGLAAWQWRSLQGIVRAALGSPSLIDVNESKLRASLAHSNSPDDRAQTSLRLARLLSLKGDRSGAMGLCEQVIIGDGAEHHSAEAVREWVRFAKQAGLGDARVRSFLQTLSDTSRSREVVAQANLEVALLGQPDVHVAVTYARLQAIRESHQNTGAAREAEAHLTELLAKSLEQAREHLQRREWNEALDVVADAHENPACNAAAVGALSVVQGDAYAALGEEKMAIAAWQRAWEQSPRTDTRLDAAAKIGDACLRGHRLQQAERWYRSLLAGRTPLRQAVYHQRMGLLMQTQGKQDAAAMAYRQAISVCPEGDASRLARQALEGIRRGRNIDKVDAVTSTAG